jgi:hypothetical protein
LEFAAEHLPAGLTIDRESGLITGTLRSNGRHLVTLRVRNPAGATEKQFTIVAGEQIALTPPMGWNSWNSWGLTVSEEKVLAAARALAASGLRDHGWTYVNIDDGWQGQRGHRGHMGERERPRLFPRQMGAVQRTGSLQRRRYAGRRDHEVESTEWLPADLRRAIFSHKPLVPALRAAPA